MRPLTSLVLAFLAAFVIVPAALTATAAEPAAKRIVFLAGGPSHGYASHEHYAGCKLLAAHLERGMGYECEVIKGFPKEPEVALKDVDCIVVYCDGAGGHLLKPHLEKVQPYIDRGVGLALIHFAVEIPQGDQGGDKFLDWIGGFFEVGWSVNPHWVADFKKLPEHPITRGVEPFSIRDEWYYHMRFRAGMEGVTPILSALPPASTVRRDGARSGNPAVREEIAAGKLQHVAWAATREDGGRGFGFTGGHSHWNWGDDNFRQVVLNAIVWCAEGEVPAEGVPSKTPTRAELEANQDYAKPRR